MYTVTTTAEPTFKGSAWSKEFGTAARGGRLIRSAFFKLVKELDDPKATGRLTARMLKVVQSDPVHNWGLRHVSAGDLSFLEGFDFTIKKQLNRVLPLCINTDINRKTGACVFHLPNFIPQHELLIAGNHTHVAFVAAAAEVNFERESFISAIVRSSPLPITKPCQVTLKATLPKASKHPILLAFGLHFYYMINNKAYSMSAREISSLCIVKAENAPTPPKNKKAIK